MQGSAWFWQPKPITLPKNLLEYLRSKNQRQKLIEHDALPDGDDETARFLVQTLAGILRSQVVDALLELVVKANEVRLNRRQARLLRHSLAVACNARCMLVVWDIAIWATNDVAVKRQEFCYYYVVTPQIVLILIQNIVVLL